MDQVSNIMFEYLSLNDQDHPFCQEFMENLQLFHEKSDQISVPGNYESDNDIDLFLKAIKYGDLSICKYLQKHNKYYVHASNELSFRWACECGKIEIAQWLYNSFYCNANAAYCSALLVASLKGHLQIVKWLLTIMRPDEISFKCAISLSHINKHHDVTVYLMAVDL